MENNTIPSLIRSGQNEQLKQLLDIKPQLANGTTEQGFSFLLLAAYYKNTYAVEMIRALRDDLTAYEAAAIGDQECLLEILAAQPDLVNQPASDGFSLLGLATFFGQTHLVKTLLEQGAEVNQASQNAMKVSPIHSAVATGNLELVQLILEHGADVNAQQQTGVTALHAAAHHGNKKLVQLLLDHGADSSIQTEEGKTALDFAVTDGHKEVAQLLETFSG